jgi:tRNA-specific 2-thiouridylase
MSRSMTVKDINLISVDALDKPTEADVKIRVQHKAGPALVTGIGNGRAMVEFKEPQLAITPGQSAVFYIGDVVLGGGVIE